MSNSSSPTFQLQRCRQALGSLSLASVVVSVTDRQYTLVLRLVPTMHNLQNNFRIIMSHGGFIFDGFSLKLDTVELTSKPHLKFQLLG